MKENNAALNNISTRTKLLQFTAIGIFFLTTFPYINKLITINGFSLNYPLSAILYGILATIASNKPTRIAVAMLAVANLLSTSIIAFIPKEQPYILYSNALAIIFILRTTATLYMYGTVVRNNNEDKALSLSVNTIFSITLCSTGISMIFIPPYHEVILCIFNILDILECIAFFFFARSSALCGTYSNDQPSERSYKFWNKYFKYYLIAYVIILLISRLVLYISYK